jgi:hypothetical protein
LNRLSRLLSRGNKPQLEKGLSIRNYLKMAQTSLIVIPANPGSRPGQAPESRFFAGFWTPAFAGVTV